MISQGTLDLIQQINEFEKKTKAWSPTIRQVVVFITQYNHLQEGKSLHLPQLNPPRKETGTEKNRERSTTEGGTAVSVSRQNTTLFPYHLPHYPHLHETVQRLHAFSEKTWERQRHRVEKIQLAKSLPAAVHRWAVTTKAIPQTIKTLPLHNILHKEKELRQTEQEREWYANLQRVSHEIEKVSHKQTTAFHTTNTLQGIHVHTMPLQQGQVMAEMPSLLQEITTKRTDTTQTIQHLQPRYLQNFTNKISRMFRPLMTHTTFVNLWHLWQKEIEKYQAATWHTASQVYQEIEKTTAKPTFAPAAQQLSVEKTKYLLEEVWSLQKAAFQEKSLQIQDNSLKISGTPAALYDAGTQKEVHLHIKSLIENITIQPQTMQEGTHEVTRLLKEKIMAIFKEELYNSMLG